MSFDAGSTNLQTLPGELMHLLLNPRSARAVTVSVASGSIYGQSFEAKIRVLSRQGKVMLGWYRETIVCVGYANSRLSGLGCQNNALITMDPANQLMLATTQWRWALLFSVRGNT